MDKRNSHISTFSGGMDRDTNFANMPKEKYYELKNGRVVVNNYSNSLSITPFKQPAKLIYLSDNKYGSALDIIIGSILIRNGEAFKLVIFSTQIVDSFKDKIWVLDLSTTPVTLTKRYTGALNFDKTHLIDGVSKYENSSNIKIYWWDNLNPFRYCNIEDTQLYTYTSSSFDSVPDFEYEQPKFISVNSSGEYKSGKVQYCYRLYKLNGTSTNISPFSGMVHLTGPNIDEESISSSSYLGSPKQTTTNTGKSVSMQIIGASGSSLLFNRIIVYSIYYDTANQPPVVKKIIDTAYGTSTFSFTDTGNMAGSTTVDINDVLFENFMPYPKAGVTKHNSLYLGNIKKDNFVLSEPIYKGLRAFRFSSSTKTTYIEDNGSGGTITINNYRLIPETDNCILLKQAQRDRYKYKRNSTILGGTGEYISYEFFIKQVILDNQTESSIYPGVTQDATIGMYDLNSAQVTKTYPSQFSFTDHNSPAINYMGAGYMRDEVYPFAIVFRNIKGQKSFPIWIADIKMPIIQDIDGKVTYTTSGTDYYDYNITSRATGDNGILYANILGIKFTIDYLKLKVLDGFQDIVGWEIVRMPRKSEDRSIVAQGLIAGLGLYGDGKYYCNESLYSDWYKTLGARSSQAIFISPEYFFGTMGKIYEIPYKNDDYIMHSYNILDANETGLSGPTIHLRKYCKTDISLNNNQIPLSSTKSLIQFTDYTLQNGNTVSMHFNPLDVLIANMRGSSLALLGTDLDDSNIKYNSCVNYCRDIDDTAYGGNTYSARFNRNYISTMNYSNLDSNDSQSLMVLGGDIYISHFDILSKMPAYSPVQTLSFTDNYTIRDQAMYFIPMESTINLNLRHGYFYSKVLTGSQRKVDYWWDTIDGIKFPVFMETAGTYYNNNLGTIAGQIQDEGYYTYNTVYSQYPIYPIYTPLPENFVNTEEFDARVIYSDTKITGESIDSWLIFRPLNYKDLDYEYGPINKLIKFKDNVYCFQTKAFSVLSINPRVALTSDSGLPVQLGTGSKLERFDYLSTKHGSYHRFGSIATDTGLYFIDGFNKKLMIFAGENVPLSDLKGVYSYINKDLQNNELIADLGYDGMAFIQYDQINNDVLFNFINTNTSQGVSITYNELLKAFVSINSLSSRNTETIPGEPPTTSIVVRDLRNSFINPTNNGLVVFQGDKIFTYDSQYNIDSVTELSSIINEAYSERKVFDNLYFDLDIIYPYENKIYNFVHTLSSHQLSECVTKIQFYNDYQNTSNITPLLKTGWQTPTGYNTSKLEREYMFQIPGNDIINPANNILSTENTYKEKSVQIPHPTFRDRMKGKYVVCKIKLKCFEDNLPNLPNLTLKAFALNYLKTLYRISY